jgi:tetratricopeptide (TPR) repeat protein
MPSSPTRVFISYSHDSPAHMDRVLELSDRLRREGIDCQIDQYEQSPSIGWPRWCVNQVKESPFVLVICTETYERRFDGKEEPGIGRGVDFEGYVITQSIYDEQCKNIKFVPIVFSSDDFAHVPTVLKGPSIYDLSRPDGYEQLYRRITGQPFVLKPELGEARRLSPRLANNPAPLPQLAPQRDFAARLSNVPLAPNPFFTGRENTFKAVHKKLASSKRAALSGMRGVGKTRAAAEYVHRHRDEYQAILWARAETRETLVGDFAAIARLLKLPEQGEKDQSVIVGAVKSWLEANTDWLLVLDNADDLALAQEFVPAIHPGHLLLTTTAQALGKVAEKVPVEGMTDDEGALLLLRRATLIDKQAALEDASAKDRELARKLANELGGLPLALDQAGAFIEETPSTITEYLEFYKKEGKRLRKERGESRSHHPSVTVTFAMAFGELAKRDAAAADLVRLCAFLAPDAIPEEIFTKGALAIGEEFARRAGNPLDFAETLKQAANLSLIQRDAPDHSLDIHRLVQEVLKDEMTAEQLREWAERAVRAVNLSFPQPDFPNWPDCERLLPHAKVCAALAQDSQLEFEEAGLLSNKLAFYLDDRAQYLEAEPLFQAALRIGQRVLGPEHPAIAVYFNNLGLLYTHQGRYEEAERSHQGALAIREKVLGPEHPDLASTLNNLAMLYQTQERYEEAEELFLRTLQIWEKALGPEQLPIASCLNNLAELYRSQGRYQESERLHRRALAIREKLLGPTHPDLAITLNNLALLYQTQQRCEYAEPLFRRALSIWEKALGPEHPYLASTLNNLAELCRDQGRYEESEQLHRRALAIREKVLSPTHPELAITYNNLAMLYQIQERYKDAEGLYLRTLESCNSAVGPLHPNFARTLENYVRLLREEGRESEAVQLEARAKSIWGNQKI